MEIHEIMQNHVAALVEYYDDSEASEKPNEIIEEVKRLLGPDAPVYRVDVTDNEKERALVHLDIVPAIILYRNHREEFRISGNWPTAQALADDLKASMQPAAEVSPLKGRHRD